MTCESKLAEAQQLIADFTNNAIDKGLIEMSVAGFAVPMQLIGSNAVYGAALTYRDTTGRATNASSYTFSARAIGPAATDRYVIVCYSLQQSGGGASAAPTITVGGAACTSLTSQVTAAGRVGIHITSVPFTTGTTAEIIVNEGSTQHGCEIFVFSVTGISSITPTDTAASTANPLTDTINCNAKGCIVGVAHTAVDASSFTWAGITERADASIADTLTSTAASDNFATTQTGLAITATQASSTAPAMCAISLPGTSAPVAARILDGYSNVTGAWSMSRYLLSSAESSALARYTTDVGVDSITDQTGGARHYEQATGANQPSLISVGTRTGARFDGSNDIMESGGTPAFITATDGYVVICLVIKAVTTNDPSADDNTGAYNAGSADYGIIFRNNLGAYSWAAINDDGGGGFDEAGANFSSSPIDQVIVCEWRHEGGTLYGRMTPSGGSPGAWQSVASGNSTTVGDIRIGAVWVYSQVDLCEMVTMSAVPNDTLKDALVTNMLAHYG